MEVLSLKTDLNKPELPDWGFFSDFFSMGVVTSELSLT